MDRHIAVVVCLFLYAELFYAVESIFLIVYYFSFRILPDLLKSKAKRVEMKIKLSLLLTHSREAKTSQMVLQCQVNVHLLLNNLSGPHTAILNCVCVCVCVCAGRKQQGTWCILLMFRVIFKWLN